MWRKLLLIMEPFNKRTLNDNATTRCSYVFISNADTSGPIINMRGCITSVCLQKGCDTNTSNMHICKIL